MKTKISVLVSTLAIGGAEQLLLEFLRNFDRQRFDIDIYCLRDPGPIGDEIAALGIPLVSGISIRRVDPFSIIALFRLFKHRQPNVLLLINHFNTLFYGIVAARLAGIRVVNWVNETNRPYRFHRLTMWLRRILHRFVHQIIAAAIGHRDYVARTEHFPLERIVAIYNGVDPKKFESTLSIAEAKARLALPASSRVVSIIAALRPDKAHEVLLEATQRLFAKHPNCHLLIVGDGTRREALENLVLELGISQRTHFLGKRRDIGDILRATDVFVLSSRPEQETFSVAVLEAMSAGIPVVCTNVGFMRESIIEDKTGYIVPVDDPETLASRLTKLIGDPTLCHRLGKNAQELVHAQFTLTHMVSSLQKTLADTADTPRYLEIPEKPADA